MKKVFLYNYKSKEKLANFLQVNNQSSNKVGIYQTADGFCISKYSYSSPSYKVLSIKSLTKCKSNVHRITFLFAAFVCASIAKRDSEAASGKYPLGVAAAIASALNRCKGRTFPTLRRVLFASWYLEPGA